MRALSPTFQFGNTVKTINPALINLRYEVRGALETTAVQIKGELAEMKRQNIPNTKYPFEKVVECHIGNPQLLGQRPVSFVREVMSCCVNPELLNDSQISADSRNRARSYIEKAGLSLGAYALPSGYDFARQAICQFIAKRDGTAAPDPRNIILCDGATQAIVLIMKALLKQNDGVMNPWPSYPLYSALIGVGGSTEVPYYLREEKNWSICLDEMKDAHQRAIQDGVNIKVLVVVNPNNPTGSLLTRETIQDLIKFAHENDITILADEVYQDNVFEPTKKFYSFNKILSEMPYPYNETELYSFHSASKGQLGECGFRAGYVQLSNVDENVHFLINKLKSIEICTNTMGQVLMALQTTPPQVNECSQETVDTFQNEIHHTLDSYKYRAQLVKETLNKIEGISSQKIEGSLFAFPRIFLPDSFINESQKQGVTPDQLYCMHALKELGLVVVPGTGFGQEPGTYHFRMSILPPVEVLNDILQRFSEWHPQFIQRYNVRQYKGLGVL